jgi:hypothetical protein
MTNQTIDFTGIPGISMGTVVEIDGASNTVSEFVRAGVLLSAKDDARPFKFIQRTYGQTVPTRAAPDRPLVEHVAYEEPTPTPCYGPRDAERPSDV